MAGKGQPKTGGRKPGSTNKKTDLLAQCEAAGVDVWAKLMEYFIYPVDENTKLQAIKIALPYLYATNKSVEHSGEVAINPYKDKPIEELRELVKAKLKEKK